jgi:hypothetical protein
MGKFPAWHNGSGPLLLRPVRHPESFVTPSDTGSETERRLGMAPFEWATVWAGNPRAGAPPRAGARWSGRSWDGGRCAVTRSNLASGPLAIERMLGDSR